MSVDSLAEAIRLYKSQDLREKLAGRLVQLAFDSNGSVAVKAIDMLLSMPQPQVEDALDALTTDELVEIEARMEALERAALRGAGDNTDYAN